MASFGFRGFRLKPVAIDFVNAPSQAKLNNLPPSGVKFIGIPVAINLLAQGGHPEGPSAVFRTETSRPIVPKAAGVEPAGLGGKADAKPRLLACRFKDAKFGGNSINQDPDVPFQHFAPRSLWSHTAPNFVHTSVLNAFWPFPYGHAMVFRRSGILVVNAERPFGAVPVRERSWPESPSGRERCQDGTDGCSDSKEC